MPNRPDNPRLIQVGAVREPYRSMSRAAMSVWFVPWTGSRHSLAELSTGVTYADLLSRLFPGSVEKKKLKEQPRDDWEKAQNWLLVLRAMHRLGIDKTVDDVLQLVKTSSAAGFEFARWFISFFDANHYSRDVTAASAEEEKTLVVRMATPIRKRPREQQPAEIGQLDEVAEEDEEDDEEEEDEPVRQPKLEIKWEDGEEEAEEVQRQQPEEERELVVVKKETEEEEDEQPLARLEPPPAPVPHRLWSEVAANPPIQEANEAEPEEGEADEAPLEALLTPKEKKPKRKKDETTPVFSMVLRSASKKANTVLLSVARE